MSSKCIRHDPCPDCGSEDNLAVYDDGHKHCFTPGCGRYEFGEEDITLAHKETLPHSANAAADDRVKTFYRLPGKDQPGVRHRNISASAVNKFKCWVNTEKEDSDIECIFPFFDQTGEHCGNQVRLKDKGFRVQGYFNDRAKLFGQQEFPPGGLAVTVTEGYYDTLAAYLLTGSRYPVCGVMSASSAKKEVVRNFEYLDSFQKIVFNFDSDEPGQKAAKEVAQLFAPGKVRILSLQKGKDANEYLSSELGEDYVREWHRAPTFMPDGLLFGTELWDCITNHVEPFSIPYPWEGLNRKLYGIRTSEAVLLTADTGVGKTSVFKAIETALLKSPELSEKGYGLGLLHLEEPKRDLAVGLMSYHAGKRFHLPDVDKTEEELRDAYDAVVNTSRLVIWDHFGSNDIDVVLAKIRHMAALGCRYIFVDHLSIIVSDQSGDERKQLDEISTKMKTLTMNLDIAVLCIIHTNRMGQVRGSSGPEKVANVILHLRRGIKDLNDWRRNVMRIDVDKNRFSGRTGPGCYLYFNEMTGRLEELTSEMAEVYEQGGTDTGNEFASFA